MHGLRKLTTAVRDPRAAARTAATRALGACLLTLWPAARIERVLATWHLPERRTGFERLAFPALFERWIATRYLAEPDPDRREALKDICMAGESGVSWAEHYEETPIRREGKVGDLAFDAACPWFDGLEAALAAAPPNARTVQIGCSSGREMAHYAQRFPALSFLGTDIDPAIVARAARVHRLPNLRFEVARAHALMARIPEVPPLILYSNGALQYVQPEHVAAMFQAFARRGRLRTIFGETWRPDGRPLGAHSRWRGNFAWSHDYRDYAEEAGLAVREARAIPLRLGAGAAADAAVRHYYLAAEAG